MGRLAWVVVASLVPAFAFAQGNARGTSGNTNEHPVRPLREEPRVAFDVKTKYRDSSALVVSGGVLVTGNPNGKGGTFGYDAAKGTTKWSLKGHLRGEPVIDGGAAYVVNDIGKGKFRLAKVDVKKGKVAWSVEGTDLGNHDGAPTVDGGRVYLVSGDRKVRAYDAGTGKLAWEVLVTRVCSGAVAVADGLVVFAGFVPEDERTLHAFDAATGAPVWSSAVAGRDCPSVPAISGGLVVARAGNVIAAHDLRRGKQRWKQERLPVVDGRKQPQNLREATITGGVVYTSTTSAILGYDLASGQPVFELPFELPSDSLDVRMPAAGGVLYVSGNAELPRDTGQGGGWIYAIDLATKQVLWKFHASKPDGYGNKLGTWTTGHILPVDDGVYLENESRLVKLVAR